MKPFHARIGWLILGLALVVPPATADREPRGTGTIRGTVQSKTGAAIGQVEVTLALLSRRTTTGDAGNFQFEEVPEGVYWLQAASSRHGSGVVQVTVQPDEVTTIEIVLDLTVHREEVVVTAAPGPRSSAESVLPVAVLDREELVRQLSPSLGETLANEPGVNSTYYAPGASRPVIRGLGGDRIRVLSNGLGTADASNVSPDHAVSVEPLAAERVEIVRGPATLFYGSNAVGGVVNVLDERIPTHVPDRALGGDLLLRGGTVDDDREAALSVQGGTGQFAWHADGLTRKSDDVETPEGTLANSATEADGGGLGVSWVGDAGYAGVAYSTSATLYGIAVEDEVTIDLDQERFDVQGAWTRPFGPFTRFYARAGSADYEHTEFEGPLVGTVFSNEEWEGRVELTHRALGPFSGAFGLQLRDRDFEAIGDEAFVQPNATTNQAAFALEEWSIGDVVLQFGARFETQDTESTDPLLDDRDFDGVSGSVGAIWSVNEAWVVGSTLARSTRFPTAEELYSNGPHIATQAFEIGDDRLGKEQSLGFDVALRKRAGRVTGELSLFAQRHDDFIYELDTGNTIEIEPGEFLPIFQFTAADAEFTGAETHVDFGLLHTEPHHLQLELRADYVRAELRDTNEPLPRIPPLRLATALHYQGARFWSDVEIAFHDDQNKIAPNETPTADYTMVHASAGYRFFAGGRAHELILRGKNLGDELARNHGSRFKDLVPLPGRDISLTYRLTF